jgi:LysM repeat protein
VPDDSVDGMGGRPVSTPPRSRSNRTVTPAIAAALVVLAASFALSVAFVLANGGLDLPAAQRASSSSGAVGEASPPGASSGAAASASVAPPRTSLAPSPAASPSARATATPRPTPSRATARPSSNRYDLLTKCPNTPDCWIYVVRQGDNLFSIARYFGVPLSVVEERNPWTKTTQLVAGQKLRLPPPTR